MPRRHPALLLAALALACNGDPADTTSSTSTGEPDTTTSTASPTTTAGSTSTTAATGEGTDGVTTGPVDPSTTGTADAGDATTTGTSGDATTSAPVDPCDPDPCLAPQHCEDGACVDPPPPGEGQVVVVEMMIDPAELSDYDAEWFELLNVTDQPFDLDGCRLVDLGVNDNDHTIAAGGPLVILPGARMVMAKTVDPAANGGIADVAYGFAQEFSLTNTGDAFILRCADIDVDVVEYAPMSWPYDVGVGMQLDPGQTDATANDDPSAWCASTTEYIAANTGTPGVANPACR